MTGKVLIISADLVDKICREECRTYMNQCPTCPLRMAYDGTAIIKTGAPVDNAFMRVCKAKEVVLNRLRKSFDAHDMPQGRL